MRGAGSHRTGGLNDLVLLNPNTNAHASTPPSDMPFDHLLDHVQRATIAYFWEGAHPVSGLAYDRRLTSGHVRNDLVSFGGSGFSFLAIVVAVFR